MSRRAISLAALSGAVLLLTGAGPAGGASGVADGHGVLFTRGAPHTQEGGNLFIWRGGAPAAARRLTNGRDPKDWPRWSPNGASIAFQMIPGWNGQGSCQAAECMEEIWVARADGSHPQQLTQDGHNGAGGNDATGATQPSWSPNGKALVFVRTYTDQPDQLVTIASSGTGEAPLNVAGDDPVWGPLGIAYVNGDDRTVWLLDPKTAHARRFATVRAGVTVGGASALAWSRTGELAVLETTFGRHIVIYSSSGNVMRTFAPPMRGADVCGLTWSANAKQLLLSVGVPHKSAYWYVYEANANGTHWRHLFASSSCSTSWR